MMMSRVYIVCLLVLAFACCAESGCSCSPQHPQQALCGANTFVIKARILGRRKLHGAPSTECRVYKVKVLQDYKNTFDPIQGVQQIFTGSSQEPCGVYFKRKVTYIISGYKKGGKLVTSACSWSQKICTVTSFQKFALKTGLYKSNCQCKVKDCTNGNCNPPTREDCVIKSNRYCFRNKNACVKKSQYGALRCGWKSDVCASTPYYKVKAVDHEPPKSKNLHHVVHSGEHEAHKLFDVHVKQHPEHEISHKVNVHKGVVYKPPKSNNLHHVAHSGEHGVHKLFDVHVKPHSEHQSSHLVPGHYSKHVFKNIDHVKHHVASH